MAGSASTTNGQGSYVDAEAMRSPAVARQAQPLLAELTNTSTKSSRRWRTRSCRRLRHRAPRRGRDRFGVVEDKVQKNLGSKQVYEFIRPMRTVGVTGAEDKKVVEIAEPFGVVAAIVPSTNPTSTAIYKVLIALKARCPIGSFASLRDAARREPLS